MRSENICEILVLVQYLLLDAPETPPVLDGRAISEALESVADQSDAQIGALARGCLLSGLGKAGLSRVKKMSAAQLRAAFIKAMSFAAQDALANDGEYIDVMDLVDDTVSVEEALDGDYDE